MSLHRLCELQRAARADGYAVPHFLGGTTEMILGTIRAAEKAQSPVALGFAPEVFSMVPLSHAIPVLVDAANRAKVPVAIQLEHGDSWETVMEAIELGATSVMFDGSGLPVEENTAQTRAIVDAAHARGVSVEAELGCVGGSAVRDAEDRKSMFTDPRVAVEFVRNTQVDSLAISFGNVHGKYRGAPCIQFDLVREIDALVDVPLVMHGGSGLTAEDYRGCIEVGISNIHFYTNVTLGLWDRLQKSVQGLGDTPVYHELVGMTIDWFAEQTTNVIDMLGSGGTSTAHFGSGSASVEHKSPA